MEVYDIVRVLDNLGEGDSFLITCVGDEIKCHKNHIKSISSFQGWIRIDLIRGGVNLINPEHINRIKIFGGM